MGLFDAIALRARKIKSFKAGERPDIRPGGARWLTNLQNLNDVTDVLLLLLVELLVLLRKLRLLVLVLVVELLRHCFQGALNWVEIIMSDGGG